MASLTPGVLSKLIENAGNHNFKATGEHRSPLLQVLEIVPSLPGSGDDPFRTRGFFLKLSDSLHSAYASLSNDHLDLIYTDKIQLGQFVRISRFDPPRPGSLVPVLRGLKPVSKRRPCVGNPVALVSSDALPIPRAAVEPTRRLSLDSARRGWVRGTPPPGRASSDKSPAKALKLSPLKTKEKSSLVPKPTSIVKRNDLKSPAAGEAGIRSIPVAVVLKCESEKTIAWNALPSTLALAGKRGVRSRNLALKAAVHALEEASATEAILHCMGLFAELCKCSKQVCTGPLAEQFLQLYQRIKQAHTTLNSLLNNNNNNTNATSWIQSAIATNLSNFDLFESKHDKLETHTRNTQLYVVLENATKKLDIKNNSPKPSPTNRKNHPSDLTSNLSHSSKTEKWSKGNGLEDAAELAKELLAVCRRWFVKYLEDLLRNGFELSAKEDDNEVVHLLMQLKRVDQWMTELFDGEVEIDDRMERVRKKLCKFLLDHVDIATRSSR